jgi:lambda family phage portal protein
MSAFRFPRRGAPRTISAKAAPPRTSLAGLRSHYAASGSALLADWFGTSASANGVTSKEARTIRRRARELRENSSIVARYAALCKDNIVGPDGITLSAYVPSTRGKNAAASTELEASWYAWADDVTPDNRTLVQALRVVVESWKVEGEALATMTVRGGRLVVTPVDADLLDQDYSEKRRNGTVVEQGVEIDATGRVVAYWIWDEAEDDSARRVRRRWDAADVLYLAHRTRPNQRRGVSPLAPVMLLIHHLERTDEALVVLNRTAASKMFQFVAQGEWASPLLDADGNPLHPDAANEEVGPGAQWVPPYGYKAETINPGQPTPEYDVLSKSLQRRIAAGLNVAHVSLSGDLTEANYGSQRGGLIGERDGWIVDQKQLIDDVMRPLFARWLRTEVLARRVRLPDSVLPSQVIALSEWFGRRWAWIDPLKDAEGIRALLEMRLTSRTRELNKMGIDVRTIAEEIAAEEQLFAKLNVAMPSVAPTPPAAPTTPAPERTLRAVP